MSEEQTKKRADDLEERIIRLEIIVEHFANMLTSEPSLHLDYLEMLHRSSCKIGASDEHRLIFWLCMILWLIFGFISRLPRRRLAAGTSGWGGHIFLWVSWPCSVGARWLPIHQ